MNDPAPSRDIRHAGGDRPPSGVRLSRVALPIVGVFLLTLLAGNLVASLPTSAKESLAQYVPQSWLAKSTALRIRCMEGRCASGMTSIGLPESCLEDATSQEDAFPEALPLAPESPSPLLSKNGE